MSDERDMSKEEVEAELAKMGINGISFSAAGKLIHQLAQAQIRVTQLEHAVADEKKHHATTKRKLKEIRDENIRDKKTLRVIRDRGILLRDELDKLDSYYGKFLPLVQRIIDLGNVIPAKIGRAK
jgi:hypothetical protein